MLNLILIVIGTPSLLFALWTISGLYKRSNGMLPDQEPKKKWWLGVCADFSVVVGIPLGVVRAFIVFYTPFLLGPVFYFIYYWILQNRVPELPEPPKSNPTITKIDSHYYP